MAAAEWAASHPKVCLEEAGFPVVRARLCPVREKTWFPIFISSFFRLKGLPPAASRNWLRSLFSMPKSQIARPGGRRLSWLSQRISNPGARCAQPLASFSYSDFSSGGAASGNTMSNRSAPKSWPRELGISLGSSRRKRSNWGSTLTRRGWALRSRSSLVCLPSISILWCKGCFVSASWTRIGTCKRTAGPGWVWRSTALRRKRDAVFITCTPSSCSAGAPVRVVHWLNSSDRSFLLVASNAC